MARGIYNRYNCRAYPCMKGQRLLWSVPKRIFIIKKKKETPAPPSSVISVQVSRTICLQSGTVLQCKIHTRLWPQSVAGCSNQPIVLTKPGYSCIHSSTFTSFSRVMKNHSLQLLLSLSFLETWTLERKEDLMPLKPTYLSGESKNSFMLTCKKKGNIFNTKHYSRKENEIIIEHLLCTK